MTTTPTDGRDQEGPAPRRAKMRAAQRRETILRAAAGVFAESGYRAARVSDVAARVGVTEPVVFQNFGSKAALFAAVLERAAADARASLDGLAAEPGPPGGLLAHVLGGIAHGRPGHAPPGPAPEAGQAGVAYGVLFADAVALAAEPGLAGPARDAVRSVAGHLADLVRRAQADGTARPDADPDAAAWLLLSVLSAARLREAAMPADLEAVVTGLALQALAPGTGDARHGHGAPGGGAGTPAAS